MMVKSITYTIGELQDYGQFGVSTGCGGGSPDPADACQALNASMASWICFGFSSQNNYFIHSTGCLGTGLGILDLSTKQDRTLDDNVRGAVISPDGSRIAAINNANIIIFNTARDNVEYTFPTTEAPQALLWSTDGKEVLIFNFQPTKYINVNDNIALKLFGTAPVS